MTALFSIGIDLGTTNCVLSYTYLDSDSVDIHVLEIPQVTAPFESEALPSLASFLYVPTESQIADRSLASFGERVVGQYARKNSAEHPDRTVVAAKSWLCHRGVDRRAPILPWQAPPDCSMLSPVTASAAYLSHLVNAWQQAFPNAPIDQQIVTLTVPASFDMSARELTLEAAKTAGLPSDLILLEEPQAALYHWIASQGENWRQNLKPGDSLLVCDCGGGTTDLTLMVVEEEKGELTLRRIAVGNHLLVGGDNMDLTLAHHTAGRFAEKGTKLNAWQSIGLWHSCREAKEKLLSSEEVQTHNVTVLGRGSRLIGGMVSVPLEREEIENVIVDGFFPVCSLYDRPEASIASGFQELGLPFESDTAITRHVASFLSDNLAEPPSNIAGTESKPQLAFPSRILFNGGVFKAKRLRSRLEELLSAWNEEWSVTKQQSAPVLAEPHSSPTLHPSSNITVLGGVEDLDVAVASGAAYYGWTKNAGGLRIRGGTARSYYVGIESAGLAVPGMPRPIQAVCVAPKGMEEGTEAAIPGREFGLVVGKPVHFRFFVSSRRPQDTFGTTLRHWDEEEIIETDPMEMNMSAQQIPDEGIIPVRFLSKVTELGMLELWCTSTKDSQRWKLEFNVRAN